MSHNSNDKSFAFYFAPEGRRVTEIQASSLSIAKREFYRANPQYKRAKGEIYWVDLDGPYVMQEDDPFRQNER